MKKTLAACASDPRQPPYNVVAETATPDYLIQNSIIELKGLPCSDGTRLTESLARIISNLGLAQLKLLENGH